jgi:hypothetical protein
MNREKTILETGVCGQTFWLKKTNTPWTVIGYMNNSRFTICQVELKTEEYRLSMLE